jgi:hypothetical protein
MRCLGWIQGMDIINVMTAQLPLSLIPHPDAILIGTAAALVEDETGGRVFLHGELALAWDVDDQVCRRLAAVQLVRIKAAKAVQVAAAFGVDPDTLRRWAKALNGAGPVALVSARSGPKGPARLTAAVVADIRGRRAAGASLRGIAAAVGVSTDSVRRALPAGSQGRSQGAATTGDVDAGSDQDACAAGDRGDVGAGECAAVDLPVLPPPAVRSAQRAAARWGQMTHAEPVFAPPGGCRWRGCCWRSPPWKPPGYYPALQRCSGVCVTGSTAWTRCSSKECCGRWPDNPALKASPGSTRSPWAGCWVWTGARRSRRSAARSPTLLPPVGPTSCWPRWPPPT